MAITDLGSLGRGGLRSIIVVIVLGRLLGQHSIDLHEVLIKMTFKQTIEYLLSNKLLSGLLQLLGLEGDLQARCIGGGATGALLRTQFQVIS